MNNKKEIPAFFEVFIIMLVVLLLQLGIFYLIFSQIDIIKMLETSTYNYYSNSLEQSAYKLENTMVNKWGSQKAIDQFLSDVSYEYGESKYYNREFTITEDIVSALLELEKNTYSTSCFVILNDKMLEDDSTDSIYFIHDSNEWYNDDNNSDITLEIGDYNLIKNQKITLGINWKPSIEKGEYEVLDSLKSEVLNHYRKAEEKDALRLAHWKSKQDLLNNDENNFVYIYPIIDKYTGVLYGILGIEIRESLVRDIMDSSFVRMEYPSGFAIVKNSRSGKKVISADIEAYTGDYIYAPSKKDRLYYVEEKNIYQNSNFNYKENFLSIFGKTDDDRVYAIEHRLNIYNQDSYYSSEDWKLLVLFDERNLKYHSIGYEEGVIMSIVISIITAILLTIIVARLFTSPIKSLVKEIGKMDLKQDVRFKRTRVKEVNVLKSTIEDMSLDVANTYLQMQNLLEIIGHSIVIFEEDQENHMYNRAGRISVLLQMPEEKENAIGKYTYKELKTSIKKVFHNYKLSYAKTFETGENEKIIRVTSKRPFVIKTIYIKYSKKVINSRIFHIYEDYTVEYLDILKLEYERNHDDLTNLPNRNYFKRLVTEKLRVNPYQNAAMVMIDLDNLKYINDIYGHNWGDEYLKKAADIIKSFASITCNISRFSGDEFFLFIRYDKEKDEVRKILKEIQYKFLSTEMVISRGETTKIRASMGVSWYPDDGSSFEDLYRYADFAMYGAKHSNKGMIYEFDRSTYEKEYIILSAKEELNKVIEEKLVEFAFQPIVSTKTGEIFAYEALMRPQSDILKTVSDVMLLAKVQFKLTQIEQITFENVLLKMEEYDELLKDKKIFINSIASKTLPKESEKIIKEKLKKYGDKIVIEITEAEKIIEKSMTVKQGYKKEFSCMIAIDDFGSGYASDNMLLSIKPDFIKIDMDLIRHIEREPEKKQRIRTIIEYAKMIDAKIIAEGVEFKEELEYLISSKVDYIQGFYLAKPHFDIIDIDEKKKEEILEMNEKYSKNASDW